MGAVAIANGLFTMGEAPRLIGGRRKDDDRIVFPMPTGAEGALYEPVELSPRGALWSFTVQRFRPKSPPYAGDDDERSFKPFALGYVELPGEVIVEARLLTDDFTSLRIGQPMDLVLTPFRKAADGSDVLTYAFRPAA
ncbi:Zn-ribbon domain-containing OB-fold protein [Phenylobacterium montanum]|uniref:OB-fold domain-containing protein n=1 Tax=Phenylobacterium montanum TaxID=2823693 RepID=A0A975G3L1_9CAUL|nr:OB-fold domain-containing protein [Caulobacter sp. S6]QUD90508.1 OB-fold domain-containing protein [Caulobacter sp. S6]